MTRIARGVIAFEYKIDEYEKTEELSKEELLSYFLDTMVDDIIDMRYSDIRPAIEMEIL